MSVAPLLTPEISKRIHLELINFSKECASGLLLKRESEIKLAEQKLKSALDYAYQQGLHTDHFHKEFQQTQKKIDNEMTNSVLTLFANIMGIVYFIKKVFPEFQWEDAVPPD